MGEIETTMAQAHRVPAVDRYALAATVTQPEHGARDWVIVSGAFAVAARFYSRYATALAEAGFAAVTYGYRGIGASRPAALRGFPAGTARQMTAAMRAPVGSSAMPPFRRSATPPSGRPCWATASTTIPRPPRIPWTR